MRRNKEELMQMGRDCLEELLTDVMEDVKESFELYNVSPEDCCRDDYSLCEVSDDWTNGATKCIYTGYDDCVIKITVIEEETHGEESYLYEEAVKAGVSDYFAESIFLFKDEKTGYIVEAQEKIEEDWDQMNVAESFSIPDEVDRDSYPIHSYVFAAYMINHAEFDYKKLFKFLLERNINDIHCGNFTFKGVDKKPVIFDYAGYVGW